MYAAYDGISICYKDLRCTKLLSQLKDPTRASATPRRKRPPISGTFRGRFSSHCSNAGTLPAPSSAPPGPRLAPTCPRPYRLRIPVRDQRVASASITDLLGEIHRGNTSAYDALLPLVYDELKRVAERSLLHEQDGHTLQPTALVHEAYLRLVDQRTPSFENRRHFFSVSAGLMRQILVDHARRAKAAKRGARTVIPLEDFMDVAAATPELHEVLELDDAIKQLAERDARQAQIVELRFFAGLSVEETAALLNVSERTVKRDWSVARAFLYRALDETDER